MRNMLPNTHIAPTHSKQTTPTSMFSENRGTALKFRVREVIFGVDSEQSRFSRSLTHWLSVSFHIAVIFIRTDADFNPRTLAAHTGEPVKYFRIVSRSVMSSTRRYHHATRAR